MKNFIKNYEKSAGETITKEMVEYLYQNIDKAEELKKIYKEMLIELKKYNNNYYSFICILINVLKFKKKQNKKIELPYDMYHISLPLRGVLQIKMEEEFEQIKTVEKKIEYKKIKLSFEAKGKEKTKKQKLKLILQAKEILNESKLDINKGIKWKEKYKNYIIKTYGRWSNEYEDYMTTLFDVGFLPTSPNLILNINRDHIGKAIKEKIKILEQN